MRVQNGFRIPACSEVQGFALMQLQLVQNAAVSILTETEFTQKMGQDIFRISFCQMMLQGARASEAAVSSDLPRLQRHLKDCQRLFIDVFMIRSSNCFCLTEVVL